MNTYWNVDKVDTRKDYIIFDDMAFEHFVCWQAFFGKRTQVPLILNSPPDSFTQVHSKSSR